MNLKDNDNIVLRHINEHINEIDEYVKELQKENTELKHLNKHLEGLQMQNEDLIKENEDLRNQLNITKDKIINSLYKLYQYTVAESIPGLIPQQDKNFIDHIADEVLNEGGKHG